MSLSGGTLFSGIGAPELAGPDIDWRWCAETEPFAAAVLDHHFGTQNLGDVTTVDWDAVEPVDLVVFGSPCQSFSVAGKRLGLDDPRGNMALVGLRAVSRVRPRWVVFENVPGLLSSDEGRDFGAFLGCLGECGYGFAYRVLDAQHFGVPQRRRRVFVVGHLGDWRPAAAVLFEPASLRGDPAPGREAREGVAPILEVGARTGVSTDDPRAGSGIGDPGDPMFTLQSGKHHGIAGTLNARHSAGGGLGTDFECDGGLVAFGGNNTAGPIDLATACNAHGGPHGRMDFETETFVTHSLRAEGFDASEDGTGRGTPLVTAFDARQSDVCIYGDRANVLDTDGHTQAIAFTVKDSGGDAGSLAPTLRAGTHDKSHANAGVMPAIAFTERTRADGRNIEAQEDLAYALTNPGSGGRTNSRQILAPVAFDITGVLATNGARETNIHTALRSCKPPGMSEASTTTVLKTGMSVRRLTPVECERLQGFPDNYTLIKYRSKPAPDGPRYRALGNAMATPVVKWLLNRIAPC